MGSSLLEGELGQVDVVFWGCEQVNQLAHFRLEGGLTSASLTYAQDKLTSRKSSSRST